MTFVSPIRNSLASHTRLLLSIVLCSPLLLPPALKPFMRISALLLGLISTILAQNGDLFPSSRPTVTTDPWQCATENLDQYFSMPTPTGDLSTALLSYGSELIKTCTTPGCHIPPDHRGATSPKPRQRAFSLCGPLSAALHPRGGLTIDNRLRRWPKNVLMEGTTLLSGISVDRYGSTILLPG